MSNVSWRNLLVNSKCQHFWKHYYCDAPVGLMVWKRLIKCPDVTIIVAWIITTVAQQSIFSWDRLQICLKGWMCALAFVFMPVWGLDVFRLGWYFSCVISFGTTEQVRGDALKSVTQSHQIPVASLALQCQRHCLHWSCHAAITSSMHTSITPETILFDINHLYAQTTVFLLWKLF